MSGEPSFFIAFGRTIEELPDVWLCVNDGTVEVAVPETGDSVLVSEGEGINILGGKNLTRSRVLRLDPGP